MITSDYELRSRLRLACVLVLWLWRFGLLFWLRGFVPVLVVFWVLAFGSGLVLPWRFGFFVWHSFLGFGLAWPWPDPVLGLTLAWPDLGPA